MSRTTVKLQIPLDKDLRDKVEKHARSQGFSSIQDFTRVMYSTVVRDNLRMGLSERPETISPAAADRLDRLAEEAIRDHKAGKLKSFNDVEEFLADLNNDEAD